MKGLFLVILLAVVVAASGCTTSGGGVTFGQGVSIVTWEPDLRTQSYSSGDQVKLLLKVENTGEYDAKDVEAKIFGINVGEWGGVWTASENLGDLKAASEQYNTPGESTTKQWVLDAPDLPKGTDISYNPSVRVSYDYKTVATKTITIVDRDELRRLIQDGKSIPGEATKYSYGPLSVTITTGDFVKTEGTDPVLPIHISVRNSGSGSVSDEGSIYGNFFGDEFDYPVEISVDLPSTMRFTDSDQCSSSGRTVEMWQGDEAEITCKVNVDPVDISQKELITVTVDYRYQIDGSASVRVIGQEDDSWF